MKGSDIFRYKRAYLYPVIALDVHDSAWVNHRGNENLLIHDYSLLLSLTAFSLIVIECTIPTLVEEEWLYHDTDTYLNICIYVESCFPIAQVPVPIPENLCPSKFAVNIYQPNYSSYSTWKRTFNNSAYSVVTDWHKRMEDYARKNWERPPSTGLQGKTNLDWAAVQ